MSMQIIGAEILSSAKETLHFELKLLANERAACIFPCTTEHRDVKVAGLSYEDDYQGNALAAILKPGRIEFRFHAEFSDARVVAIAQLVFRELKDLLGANLLVTYQGRTIREFSNS